MKPSLSCGFLMFLAGLAACAPSSHVITGTARPLHIGARSHVWSIDIVDAAGKLVCISRLTIAVIKRGVLS